MQNFSMGASVSKESKNDKSYLALRATEEIPQKFNNPIMHFASIFKHLL
jgi:hypothetical protein